MKKLGLILLAACSFLLFTNTGVSLAGKANVSHDWKAEAQTKNPQLAEKVTSLIDRLLAIEESLKKEKVNGSKIANNLRGGIVNLRHSVETLYEPLGGKEVIAKRINNAYKGVSNRQRMVENMFKRADFSNSENLLKEFKEILSDLDSLRPAIEKAN